MCAHKSASAYVPFPLFPIPKPMRDLPCVQVGKATHRKADVAGVAPPPVAPVHASKPRANGNVLTGKSPLRGIFPAEEANGAQAADVSHHAAAMRVEDESDIESVEL